MSHLVACVLVSSMMGLQVLYWLLVEYMKRKIVKQSNTIKMSDSGRLRRAVIKFIGGGKDLTVEGREMTVVFESGTVALRRSLSPCNYPQTEVAAIVNVSSLKSIEFTVIEDKVDSDR